MSFFGSTTTSAPQTGGGLFGASNTQQQPAGGGGLFAFGNTSATNTNTTGGGLFGQQQQQPAATGLFGASTQQTQPATSGGLLGATQQPAATGGGLFGSSNTTQSATGGGLFGASNTTQPATGGGLFGASSAPQPSTTGGGLFGSSTATQPATTGGLFGAPTTQPQQPSGGGIFSGGGSFLGSKPGLNINTNTGTTSATTSTNPLFGGGAFGQSQAKPPIFGQPSTTATGSTNTNPLFGGGNTSTLGTSVLGGVSQAGGLGSSMLGRTTVGPVQQQADAQAQHVLLQQRIEGVYNAWNPASLECRFQHAFYNMVDPSKVAQYQRPLNVSNQMWEKARRENPNPSCFVPVFATGFDDLRARVEAQSAQSEKLKQRLTDVKKRLDVLSERHALSNVSRLKRAAAQQTQVAQRLLGFAQHLHLLIPAIRSSAIRPEEEQLRGRLEEIEEELRRGRLAGKMNELWALIGAVGASAEKGRSGDGSGGEWAVVDEEGLAQITQILSDQQAGLAHLTKVLQRIQRDIAVILVAPGGSSEDLESFGSSSTLRASALR
ncbi:Nucleoporin nup44 [Termitomyces sp. J132]|nr:Nucleoporin nup44 [Termitomyces sp. J132]